MKRPFLVAAVAGLAAAYLSIYSDRYIVLLAGIIIMAGYLIFYKHSKTPLFYILFVLIFPVMVIRTEYYSRGMCYQGKLSEDCYAYVKGEAVSVTTGDNSYATKLSNALLIPDWQKDDEKGNETVKSGIIIYSQDSFCHAGDYVYVKVKLKDFEEPTNEGQFNTRAYYTSAGINYQGIFNEAVNITSRAGTLKAGLLNMADAIKNVYDNTFTEKNAGTMRAIVLGDRSVLDDEVKEVYKKNGISHILAISALHITMVGMSVYRLLKKFIRMTPAAVVSSVIILSYLYITGNSVSAGRAVIMILVFMLADVLGRTSDGANTLGLAVVILIIINPYYISNSGFIMSFLAMTGIIFVKPVFSNKETVMLFFKKKKTDSLTATLVYRHVIDMLVTGLCVQIATLPVMLSMSGQIAIISLLLNIIVIPLMSVIMVSGILTGITGLISMKAALWTAGAGEYILEMNFETEVNYDLSVSRISEKAKLNYSKLNLTKGFTKQLKAEGGTIKSCTSGNKKVATVNNSGKVSAKSIGKTTIKAKLANGKTLSCTVSVKPNKYQAKKITVKDVVYNTSEMKAYAASFDSKGNLVLKFKLVNNSYGKITNVSKFKVTVKDSSKKNVVSYNKKNYKTSVASYSDKECTVTIPKSALKKDYKKIDLRTCTYSIIGKFAASSL